MAGFAQAHVSLAGLSTAVGKIMSTPSNFSAQASVEGVTVTVRILDGVTVTLGNYVLLNKYSTSWFVVGVLRAPPAVPPPPDPLPPSLPPSNQPVPPPKPTTRSGKLIVAPVQTATYRDGKWRTDVPGGVTGGDTLQGVFPGYGNNTGCAFYGSKPTSLVGATVTRATIRVRRSQGGIFGDRQSTIWLTTQSTRPAGAPTLAFSSAGPTLAVGETQDTFVIPTAWAQAMVDGTHGGLAVFDADGNPYMRLSGRATWSPAWTMTIYWQR